jgi:allantoinase
VNVTVETCPHYLLLTEEDVVRLGAPAKCFPTLRSEALRLGLWRRFEEGSIDTIGSDHSPAPPELKQTDDFFAVWGGISGCQHGFPLMMSEALAREPEEQAWPRLAAHLAERVARRFRLDPRKGRIAEGKDADFSIIDPRAPHVLSNEELLYRYRQGPYDGRRSTVKIVRTFVRGRTVFGEGRVAQAAGICHFLRP